MAGFVPKNKLSKKAQKELNRQRRTMWDFSPVSRTVDSRKLYNRRKKARDRFDDYGASFFDPCSEVPSVPAPITDRMICHIYRVPRNSELFAQQIADLPGQLII